MCLGGFLWPLFVAGPSHDFADANKHPAQQASSLNKKVITDQDLSTETSEDSDDTFYTKWGNAIEMYMSQPINASENKDNSFHFQWLNAMNMFLSEANGTIKMIFTLLPIKHMNQRTSFPLDQNLIKQVNYELLRKSSPQLNAEHRAAVGLQSRSCKDTPS